MNEILNLNPQCIWKNFYALTQVPRPSGHLEKIQQFLLDFAKKAEVEAFKDPAGNIVMRKPASAGMENRKGVILQAHMDMVPQKTPESQHNFVTDPIEPWIDGEWVKAKGTTLGADDGLGVAAIMAVMEDKTLKHGPIDALITADEETGMFGANDLPEGELQGDILLNLDSETWGKFVIGSAGGIDVTATLDYQEVETDAEDAAVRVTLKGLRGGHSGLEIHEGRANANKQMVRFVREAIEECDARLASWHGGNMRNAIPFKAEVVLTLPKENIEALKELVDDWKEDFIDEFKTIETNGIEFYAEDVETPAKEVPVEVQDNLERGIRDFTDGILQINDGKKLMSPDANSTIRLTYGNVKSYDPRDGVSYHYYTTLRGVIEKEDPESSEFAVPARLKELYNKKEFGRYANKDGELPTCFITNNDITGGNSGSPVINGKGQLIGLAFDGNSEAMSGDIDFEENLQRCICLDSRYMLWVIDIFAGAKNLIEEMDIVR